MLKYQFSTISIITLSFIFLAEFAFCQYAESQRATKQALSQQDSLHIFNPFIQPNDSVLVAYGSGDANKDGKIDIEDYYTIKLMLGNKTTDDSREFDRADVDGDGIITMNGGEPLMGRIGHQQFSEGDGKLILKYLDKEIPYLPGHWNKLKTRQERWDWLQNCLAIDWTGNTKWNPPNWIGKDYKSQMFINFTGIDINEQDSTFSQKYSLKDNRRFNIPMYGIDIPKYPRYDQYLFYMNYDISDVPFSFYRALNIVVIGDNAQEWASLRFIEPQDPLFRLGASDIVTYTDLHMHYITSLSNANGDNAILLTRFKINDYGTVSPGYTNQNLIVKRQILTSVEDIEKKHILVLEAMQNYPNPFNASTTIEYSIQKPERVSLTIYDVLGRKVQTSFDGFQSAGRHRISVDLSDYSTGLYFSRLQLGNYVATKKIMFIK